MKILLTGANGQLGSELARRLPALGELTAADRAALDLAKVEAIRRALREAKPQLVVNCAAYTAVDRAESEPTLAHAVNAVAPAVLAEEARRLGALLVHYSTDYVFDGEKGAPYVEEDPCNPLNVYGRTKLAGEEAVRGSGCRHLVLRASWVYAPRGRNFVRAILRKARAGEPLRVVDDQTGVPTSAAFLAEATMRALAAGGEGLYHLAPTGATTWYGFACAIVERLGLEVAVTPIRTEDYPTAARRPRYSVLDATRARSAFRLPADDWRQVFERVDIKQLELP
ncbi:MAG: dTDP-4-dehydrorhamnose reductase [Burkholderiales bacterium]|nr:dTDP-4-dehydrorhamnose reductase [Burkholderiales bacterium]